MRKITFLVSLLLILAPEAMDAQDASAETAEVMLVAVQMALEDAGIYPQARTTVFDVTNRGRSGPEQAAAARAVSARLGARTVSGGKLVSCTGPSVERRVGVGCRFTDPQIRHIVRVRPPRSSADGLTVSVATSSAGESGDVYLTVRTVLVNQSADGSWQAERIVMMHES